MPAPHRPGVGVQINARLKEAILEAKGQTVGLDDWGYQQLSTWLWPRNCSAPGSDNDAVRCRGNCYRAAKE